MSPNRSELEGPREGALVAPGPSGRRRWWSNWAGNQRCLVRIVRPTGEAELARVVAAAAERGGRVKAVGAGHSFSGLATTDDVLVDLCRHDRVLSLDHDAGTVTVEAGIRLRALSEYLWTRGLALENLGDIDVQSVAGATSTGTHGTGLAFGCLSSRIVGMRIVDGTGCVHVCDEAEDPELLHVARVGLGALGIVSTVTLRVVPAFHLHALEEPRRIDDVLSTLEASFAEHDHFECFWVPHTGWALTKTNRRTDEPVRPRRRWDEFVQDRLSTNLLFDAVNRVGVWRPGAIIPLGRRLPSAGRVDYVDRSYRVFASPRHVRFLEMEYAVPLEATVDAVRAVQRIVAELDAPVSFPVEVRATAGDDIPLSMASGRPTGFVAVHSYRDHPADRYFSRVEDAMRDLGGRPHWGKVHRRQASDLADAYAGWDRFQVVRDRMDPHRVFANPELDRVLGP